MPNIIKNGMTELSNHALWGFNYNPLSGVSYIMDNLNDFAKYTLATHHLVVDIKKKLETKEFEWCPMQIDFMVIPQAVVMKTLSDKYRRITDEKQRSDMNRYIHGFDILMVPGATSKLLKQPAPVRPLEIVNFGSCSSTKLTSGLWDIEEILDHPKVGYLKNRDNIQYKDKGYYWVDTIDINQAKNKMYQMLKKCQDILKDLDVDAQRYMRYVFIIDRRDKENLNRQNMKYNIPNKEDVYRKKGKDKIYLIIHKECHKLASELYLIQEMGFGLSKSLMIRTYSDEQFCCKNLGISDDFNGYKFAFSYHIYANDNITPYFYYGQGCKILNINDMEWLWPRLFIGVNNISQKLNDEIKDEIQRIKNTENLQLRDVEFDEFLRQINELKK